MIFTLQVDLNMGVMHSTYTRWNSYINKLSCADDFYVMFGQKSISNIRYRHKLFTEIDTDERLCEKE